MGLIAKNEIKKRRHEVDLEGIGKAREEIERNEIGDDEAQEERQSGVSEEKIERLGRIGSLGANSTAVKEFIGENVWEEGEEKAKNSQEKTDQAGLEKERKSLMLDDFFGGGDLERIGSMHGAASTAETDAEENAKGRE